MDQNQPYGHNMQGMSQQQQTAPQSRAAMGIVSLVLGIIALLTSFLPIINNFSALLALIGLIFGIVGIVITVKNKCGGKGLAIAGLILNVLAMIIVLASQAAYTAVIDEALSSNAPSQTISADNGSNQSSQGAEATASTESFEDLALGTAVELNSGMTVSVDSVEADLENYNGDPIVGITVTYTNNGSSSESFNVYDWKGQDAQGAQRSTTYYSEAANELNSGTLAAGGTVTGNVYFEGPISKIVYEQMISFDDEIISWVVA